MKTLTLYRPVGLKEAELILDSGCAGFPPRLPDQPIFYPVLNAEYARQIARDWNTPDTGSGYAGFVTAFEVDAEYVARFETRAVGARMHQELWVPAEQLAEFNTRLVGPVRFIEAHYGPDYRGPETPLGPLPAQPEALARLGPELAHAVRALRATVLFNFAWWGRTPAQELGLSEERKSEVLAAVRAAWTAAHPTWPLPPPEEPGE